MVAINSPKKTFQIINIKMGMFMSDTITDVVLDNLTYQNVNALSGIAVGTKVILQFKGSGNIRVQTKAFQPATSSMDGVQLIAFEFYVIDSGESTIWAKGTGRLSVQVA